MNAAQIIQSCDFDGVRLALTPEGELHYLGSAAMVAEWLPILRANKTAILEELHRERRHKKVQAMLGDDLKYAVMVEDDSTRAVGRPSGTPPRIPRKTKPKENHVE